MSPCPFAARVQIAPADRPRAVYRVFRSVSSSARRIPSTLVIVAAVASAALLAQASALPNRAGSLKFAAMGDRGNGDRPQYEMAEQMAKVHNSFAFDLVIMLGDNMYGGQSASDYVKKFETPYAPLLSAGVKFQASIGNHDRSDQVNYRLYNMNGQRYYTYTRANVRFIALDSNLMDKKQLDWLETTLRDAREDWKIPYFHHPLYSNAGRHGSAVNLRVLLEPLFVKYGVNVVFSGHDHVYERIKPQKGIYYFVSGSAGQLRKGDMEPSEQTAASFDQDRSFMALEIIGSDMYFQTISRTGQIVDSGVVHRQPPGATEAGASPALAGAGRPRG
jgi:predicted MPP superfamily phosphohydrolase